MRKSNYALLLAVPLLAGATTAPTPLTEYGCQWSSAKGIDPELRVLGRSGKFAPTTHIGEPVICIRSNIVPASDDWKVGASGRILYIVEQVDGRTGRLAELDFVDGKFSFYLLDGKLSDEESNLLEQRLSSFNSMPGH